MPLHTLTQTGDLPGKDQDQPSFRLAERTMSPEATRAHFTTRPRRTAAIRAYTPMRRRRSARGQGRIQGGGYKARQHTMSSTGAEWVGEALRAATLEELRGSMPAGREVEKRAQGDPDGIVEIWW